VGQAKVDRNVALGIRPFLGPTPIRRTLLASPYQLHISAESSQYYYVRANSSRCSGAKAFPGLVNKSRPMLRGRAVSTEPITR